MFKLNDFLTGIAEGGTSSDVKNCVIARREDAPPLFTITELNGHRLVIANLDGYAIIPTERYEHLINGESLQARSALERKAAAEGLPGEQ